MITNTIAVDYPNAREHTTYLLSYCLIVFIIVKTLRSIDQLRLFLLVIIVYASKLGLTALSEGKYQRGRLENIGPLDAHSSNEFGVFLAAIIPFTVPFIIKGRMFEKIIVIISLPIILNAFSLCSSRGAFVSLVFSVMYVLFFASDKRIKKIIFFSCIFILPILMLISGPVFRSRIASLWESPDVEAGDSLVHLSAGRTGIWIHGMKMIKDYPYGTGPEGFRALSRFYIPKELLSYRNSKTGYGSVSAHNSYLQIVVEQGYLGLLIYLVICLGILWTLYKSARRLKRRKVELPEPLIGLFIVSLNMSFAVSLCGNMFGAQVYYEFFWWQVALSIASVSILKNIEQQEISTLTSGDNR